MHMPIKVAKPIFIFLCVLAAIACILKFITYMMFWAYIAIGLAFVAIIFMAIFMRCPHCHEILRWNVGKVCPHCKQKLDD